MGSARFEPIYPMIPHMAGISPGGAPGGASRPLGLGQGGETAQRALDERLGRFLPWALGDGAHDRLRVGAAQVHPALRERHLDTVRRVGRTPELAPGHLEEL